MAKETMRRNSKDTKVSTAASSKLTKTNQPKLNDIINKKPLSDQGFQKLVTNAVIDAHLSARIVENKSVKALLNAGFPGMKITRQRISTNIERDYEEMKSSLLKKLETINFVCLCADCWSSHHR